MIDFDAPMAAKDQPAPPATDYAGQVERVKRALAPYRQRIDVGLNKIEAHKITDDDSLKAAVEVGAQAKKLIKAVDKVRKDHTQAAYDYKKAVDSLAKGFTDSLKRIERVAKDKISQYQQWQELERRKAEKARQEALDAERARMEAEAEKAGVEVPDLPPVAVEPDPPRVIRTEDGSAHQRKTMTYEVVDESSIPRAYLMVDDQGIKRAIKGGIMAIPGLRIFEKRTTIFNP